LVSKQIFIALSELLVALNGAVLGFFLPYYHRMSIIQPQTQIAKDAVNEFHQQVHGIFGSSDKAWNYLVQPNADLGWLAPAEAVRHRRLMIRVNAMIDSIKRSHEQHRGTQVTEQMEPEIDFASVTKASVTTVKGDKPAGAMVLETSTMPDATDTSELKPADNSPASPLVQPAKVIRIPREQ
jgi:hypothetical protein